MSKHNHKDVLQAVIEDGEGLDIYRKINTACLIIIAAVSITVALIYTKVILIPLVISLFIYTMMTPLIRFMRIKWNFPNWLAAACAGVLVLILFSLLVIFIINSITNMVQVAGTYQANLVEAFNRISIFTRGYNIPFPEEVIDLQGMTSLVRGPYVTNLLRGFGGVTLQVVSYSLLVVIFVFFFLMGSGKSKMTNPVIKEAQNKISAYLFIHLIMSLLTGFLVGIVYVSAGVEFALMFAALAVILNFIPTAGSIIAVLLPLPIAFIQFDLGPQFWIVLLIPSAIQFTIGSIIEPKLLGTGLDLHPIAVVGSLVFWALVWGIPGAFLAVPITSAIRFILSQIGPTRPIAEILSGRLPK